RAPRQLRLARRGGQDAEPPRRGQSRPRGGLSANGGARFSRRDPSRHHAPAQRSGLQPPRPLRPRRLALTAPTQSTPGRLAWPNWLRPFNVDSFSQGEGSPSGSNQTSLKKRTPPRINPAFTSPSAPD